VADRDEEKVSVVAVESGDGVAEADGDASGEAGRQLEDAAFASGAGEVSVGEGGDGGVPVDGGHRGSAVAGAAGDEPGGEVVAVQERAVGDEEFGACFEGVRSAAQARRAAVRSSVVMGVSGGGDGDGGDVAVGGYAEADGLGAAGGGHVGLGEFAGGGGEADLEAFGFAGPAFAFGFGDAGVEVVADFFQAAALG
jgi:hypothetical protein